MPEEKTVGGGPIDSTARILRELLRSPKFKATITILLRELDPEATPELVRTIFWEDPLFFLSLVAALPALINACLQGLRETLIQTDNFPQETLIELLAQMVDELDGEALGEIGQRSILFWQKLSEDENESLRKATARLRVEISRARGEGIDTTDTLLSWLNNWIHTVSERAKDPESETSRFISGVGEVLRKNPDFLTHVLAPITSGIAPAGKE